MLAVDTDGQQANNTRTYQLVIRALKNKAQQGSR